MTVMLVMLMVGVAQTWANPTVRKSIFSPVDGYSYPDNMTMVIQLRDGDTVVDTCEVAAFIGGECRGTARALGGLYYLVIIGQGYGQPMTLCTCLNGEIVTIDDTLQYASDTNIGTPWEPYVINLQVPQIIKGDANGDGVVNTADIAAIIALAAQSSPLTSPAKEAADVNGDGKVDIADIIAVINNDAWK